jgi:hypothetical protein
LLIIDSLCIFLILEKLIMQSPLSYQFYYEMNYQKHAEHPEWGA